MSLEHLESQGIIKQKEKSYYKSHNKFVLLKHFDYSLWSVMSMSVVSNSLPYHTGLSVMDR